MMTKYAAYPSVDQSEWHADIEAIGKTFRGEYALSRGIADFVRESNAIERVYGDPTPQEIEATAQFVRAKKITIQGMVDLVAVYQPNAELRDKPGMNVRVGDHIPPGGGQYIVDRLENIINIHTIPIGHKDPNGVYKVHLDYETLHPFMDGNGRSGRALWLRMMYHAGLDWSLGFLHTWYYQSLGAGR